MIEHIAHLWQIRCILVPELHTESKDLEMAPIGIIPCNTDPMSTLHCTPRWSTVWLKALVIALNNVQQPESTKLLTLRYACQPFSPSGAHESTAQRL